MSQYGYGRRKELQVCEFLERRGYNWKIAPGSRSPVDLLGTKGRRKWAIQVKATRKSYIDYTRLTIDAEKKLVKTAKRMGRSPVLALASGYDVWFVTVPDDDLLLRGKLKPLKYEYEQ